MTSTRAQLRTRTRTALEHTYDVVLLRARLDVPFQLKDAKGQKIKVTGTDAKRLFKAADTSRDGFLNFNEFVCLMAVMQKGDGAKKLDLVFRIYDTDKSGMLEEGEIRTLLEQLLTTQDPEEKTAQITKVLEMLMKHDSDGNKKISQAELQTALADAGVLDACVGQNIDMEAAADAVYNVATKSSACAVM